VAKIFGNEGARSNLGCSNSSAASGSNVCAPTLSDIAFYYWRTDLRSDLTNNVPPYFPDTATGITGSTPYDPTQSPAVNQEIYFNPANDPASWQHLVMYIIGLGVPGVSNINIPAGSSIDWDQTGSDEVALRTGTKQWPQIINNDPSALDDTWHATINSRGEYFNAGNPSDLANALDGVLNTITQRTGSSTAVAVSASVLSAGSSAYAAGYSSTDWSGYVRSEALDPITLDLKVPLTVTWDAGCKLTGGPCKTTTPPVGAPGPAPLDPTGSASSAGGFRHIVTKTIPSSPGPSAVKGGGIPFQWSSLSTAEQGFLNTDPSTGTTDAVGPYGSLRLAYIRGVRSQESGSPQFHPRSSVLGAVVNSQAAYVSFPSGGFSDTFPSGSPEDTAAIAGNSYEQFAFDNRNRAPMVYAGANDGMLHAFDAASGLENWAYVPATVYPSLSKYARNNPFVFTSFVDNTPIVRDAFFTTDSKWHSILVGGLRLGGRGVYAIDVTDPASTGTETSAASNVLWEFSNVTDPSETTNLGYTFGSPNIGRIRASGGKWVVLVPSGYFCANTTTGPNPPNVPESSGSTCPDGTAPAGASTGRSSLFVLDAATGALIKEIQTPSSYPGVGSINSYGLGTPVLGDYLNDQIADFAVAGDMQGNVWRFDLSDPNPSNWPNSVDLIYTPATQGAQPITVEPRLFPDPSSQKLTAVFGTGRYLGLSDRTSSIPQQAFYGIREVGASTTSGYPAGYYPVKLVDLTAQVLTVNGATGNRTITSNVVPTAGVGSKGWYFNLPNTGERAVTTAGADFNTNRALLITLLPGGNNPCNPSRQGALMIIDGPSGGAPAPTNTTGASAISGLPNGVIGTIVNNPPISGGLPIVGNVGGGGQGFPGLTLTNGGGGVHTPDTFWRRRAWRELF
jgi:type IV pilus assembly protein PilY1